MAISTKKVPSVTLYRMSTPEHDCPWGLRAVNLLTEQGISFEDIKLQSPEEINTFKAKYGVSTTPQIFFGEERIGGYTDLAEHFKVKADKAEYSYTPVIALFSTAGLMTLATSLGMTGFMGISLSMLASLKLMDLKSFTESFEKYDLITKRFKPYGKAYPFAELAIGLGFLSGISPLVVGTGALVTGVNGAISVFKAIYIDKMALNCACVGGNSKAPLGIVSLAENAIMAGMGAMLTFSFLTGMVIEPSKKSEALPANVSINHGSTGQHNMTGHSTMSLGPADQDYDLRFIDAMIPHHEGAVIMARTVLQHSQRSQLRQLASEIIKAQEKEIAQMRQWRKNWYPKASDTPMAWHSQMKHMMPMSPEQISAMRMDTDLGNADAEFDLRFLNAMIPHHEAAVSMARDLHQKSKRPEMQLLAQNILASQQAEIEQMKKWRIGFSSHSN
jgi:uncharacterized protein (DUF305 family)/glutaredoxin